MNYQKRHLKGYIGKTVNLYFKDGSVMACVVILRISNNHLWTKASPHSKPQTFKLSDIQRAETVDLRLLT